VAKRPTGLPSPFGWCLDAQTPSVDLAHSRLWHDATLLKRNGLLDLRRPLRVRQLLQVRASITSGGALFPYMSHG